MKAIKITLLSFLGLLILLVIVSFFMPSKVHVERSMVITAHPHQIFPYLNNFRKWVEWSSWHKKDSTTQYSYSGLAEGPGSSFAWRSKHPQVGIGEMKILESYADTFIKTKMTFEGMGISYSYFKLAETDAGTKVTWIMESNGEGMPFYFIPISKYFNLFMDQWLGKDFEEGLALLQGIMAKLPHYHIGDYEAEIRDFPGLDYIGIREKIPGEVLSQQMNAHYSTLENIVKNANQVPKGAPFTINYFARNNVFDMMVALGVQSPISTTAPVVSKQLPAGKWMLVKYTGGYSGISSLYQKGFELLASQNLKPSGAPMEFYLVNPAMEPDSNKWITEVVFPFIE
jgi:effector-binding domain-containing protein